MAEEAQDTLLEGISRAYKDSKYADFEIVCNGKTWKVNKLVLCAQSEFFRKTCDGEFKEATTDKVELPDDDPQTVDAMLAFLYDRKYGDEGNSQSDTSPLTLDVRVFTIADKYFINSLKKVAGEKFAQRAEEEWSEASFSSAISELYSIGPGNDRTIKDTVLSIIKGNSAELFGDGDTYANFHAVLNSNNEFAADVGRALARHDNNNNKNTYKCPNCETKFTIHWGETTRRFTCPLNCNMQAPSWWKQHLSS